ncbi:hypothetical protein C0581_00880 [Candidatus Parcubacteria bacterium]|nr:MAG: hypothetical protein C0581_00880 [Candidatus Parcubacteria bacterium]
MIVEKAQLFMEYSKKIAQTDLSTLSNKELSDISNEWFFTHFHDSWTLGWPAVLVDFERNLFSNHLLNYLKQKIEKKKYEVSVGDVFSALTTPVEETFAQLENMSLLRLLETIYTDKDVVALFKDKDVDQIQKELPDLNSDIWKDFMAHYESYCWLPFMYTGPAWGHDYFLESLKHLIKQNTDPQKELQILEDRKKQVEELHDKYLKDLEIHDDFQVLFEVARRFVYSKSYRKDAMYYGCYIVDSVLKEIAKRAYVSIDQVRRLYPWEIEDFCMEKGPDVDTLNSRAYAVQYSDDGVREMYDGGGAKTFVDSVEFVEQKNEIPREILGDCASVGKVRGTVRIVNSREDMDKMEKGNILVSYATSPDIMPAIKKASAIVTDLGGIICHAAIVSREFHIPCVVGTKIATQVLKDEDIIEVDATHGIIRIIK